MIFFLDGSPTEVRGAVTVRVIAGKHEEFVIAGGHIEVRSRRLGRWSAIAELDELFLLPLEVAANRRRDEQIEGSVLVKRLPDDPQE